MGTELDNRTQAAQGSVVPVRAGLDERTASLVRDVIANLSTRHSEVRAIILYGSVARGEARPLDDLEPSDVDLLVLVDLARDVDYIPYELHTSIYHSLGLAEDQHPAEPREVQVMLAWRGLADWDPTFVESVARDGILLWARGPLPVCLAPVAERDTQAPEAT